MEERIKTMLPLLNEYQRRIFLASEAMSYGWGSEDLRRERIRKEGSGRKPLTEKYPRIKEHIPAIVDPKTYGNPERVLSYLNPLNSNPLLAYTRQWDKVCDTSYFRAKNAEILSYSNPT